MDISTKNSHNMTFMSHILIAVETPVLVCSLPMPHSTLAQGNVKVTHRPALTNTALVVVKAVMVRCCK